MRFRSAAVSLLLILGASASNALADTPPSPSVELLQRLKQAYDNSDFLRESFYSEESLKSFFNASAIHWPVKDGERPYVGKIAIIATSLIPDADIRVSRLVKRDPRGNPAGTAFFINILKIRLTQADVTAVFGTPREWTRPYDPKGERITKPVHYGDDLDWLLHPPAGAGVTRRAASFSVAKDGTVNSISLAGFASG